MRDLKRSTDHRPSWSLDPADRSSVPAAVLFAPPCLAMVYTVRTISLLISARISVERMLASSVSASSPCTARRSCANSIEYSPFSARVFASTDILSILNAISAIWPACVPRPVEALALADPSPADSPSSTEAPPPCPLRARSSGDPLPCPRIADWAEVMADPSDVFWPEWKVLGSL